MDAPKPEAAKPAYEDVAGLLEYALTRSEFSDQDIARAWERAQQLRVASVIVRPSDVETVARWAANSTVRLGTIVDSPYGYSNTACKLYAARDMLRLRAKEIDTVIHTGKLISRQFQYLEMELLQMAESCHQSGATLKINMESEHLDEELKILCCRIARRAGADYIGTNRLEDVALLKAHSRDRLKIKISAPNADLDTILAYRDAGITRIQVSDPAPVLEAWKARIAVPAATA